MLSALTRKLLRDLAQMKGQVVAICPVMACGVATFVMSLTTLQSLSASQATYYDRYRFAEIFARVKRAPQSLAQQISDIPGVGVVQTRIVRGRHPRRPRFARAGDRPNHLIARAAGDPELNDVYLRSGRYLQPGARRRGPRQRSVRAGA